MEDIIKQIKENWYKNIGTNNNEINNLEQLININFPEDYKHFVKWSNGGEGKIKENNISLWKIENLKILNDEYQIQKYLGEKFIGIGTDGGGICYGYNLTGNQSKIFKCPLGDLDIDEITIVADSFEGFLKKANEEEL